MARRGENIRKRKDGRWEGRYSILLNGRKKLNSVYARSYSEVKEKLLLAKTNNTNEMQIQSIPNNLVEFGVVIQEWLNNIKETRKPSTYARYYSICKKHLGHLTDVPFFKIDENTVENCFNTKDYEMSENMKNTICIIVNRVIKFGNRFYHTDISLIPCCSKQKKKAVEIFNQTEQSLLFGYLYDQTDNYKRGILICLFTGLRLGEICALKWSNIDFDNRILRVTSTVQRIPVEGKDKKTELCEGLPKSSCSIREIPLPDSVIRILRDFTHKGNYVIRDDRPMEPRNYEKKLKTYLNEANISDKNFHCLRHTFATNCIESGMDIKSLSEILGHSDVQITLNKYVHPTMKMKRQHMENLSNIYGQLCGQFM